jgi:pimeloyl-ACP methyl ester carboxylesterase
MISRNRFKEKTLPFMLGQYYNLLHVVAPHTAAKQAFELFSDPRGGAIKERDLPFLGEAVQGEVVSQSGFRIRTYVWPGPSDKTVLLLHGWKSNSGRWRRLAPFLIARGYTVAAIDAPAHGQSEGRIFNALLFAEAADAFLQQKPVDYAIGHSAGGMALAYFTTHFSAPSLQKIVLLSAPSELTDIAGYFNKILRLNTRTRTQVMQYFEHRFGKPLEYFSVAEFCKRIELPTLVVQDRLDPVVRVEDALKYQQALQQGKLFLTDGLGHELQDAKVFEEIASFLHTGLS